MITDEKNKNMKRTMNMKNFFASSAWRLGGAARRAATALLLCVMTCATAWANDAVTYIDMNGDTQTVTEYTEVTSAMTADGSGNINWSSGTYVVKSDVTLSGSIRFLSDVIDLIVCDGATLTVNGSSNGAFSGNALNIYAQSNGTGMGAVNANRYTSCYHLNIAGGMVTLDAGGDSYGLYIYSGSDSGLTVNGGDVTIRNNDNDFCAFYFYGSGFFTQNGGKLTVTNSKDSYYRNAIRGYGKNTINFNGGTAEINGRIRNCQNINLNGGNVTVNGEIDCLYGYTVTYDFTSATDSYYIQSFSNNISPGETRTVKVADGKGMKDSSGNIYSCTLTDSKISAISGNTLTPATQTEYIQCCLGTGNDGSAEHPYTISDANGWIAFCLALDDNATWNHFSGKTVKLDANITVTQMAGGSNHAFTGTFDGNHKTLTLNYGTAQAPIDAEFVAPFVEVSGGATFINLNIDGHIYAAYTGSSESGVGGLIGHLFGGITIEGCTSTVEINSTKDRVGGFVGLCEHAVTFTDCKSSAVVTCTGSGSGFVGWSRASEYTIAFYGCLFNGKVLKKNGVGSGNGGFVGWKGYHKTVEITNCLVDPAAVAEGETMADDNSATFCRYSADTSLDNQATSITNCYYTETFGNAQGKQRHSISAGDNVTVANAGTATTYDVSGITSYGTGILYDNVLYAGNGDVVSLTLGCTAPSGYYCTGYTATAGILNGTTLTMPNGNVTINATLTPIISYIDENGETQQCTNYTLLNGTETTLGTSGQETWYVVDGTLNYSQTITISGNVHLILKDNAVMNVGTEETPINGHGISCVNSSISIYAQSMGESQGQLHLNTNVESSSDHYGIRAENSGSITINGGEVEATGKIGIYAINDATVNINRGKVTAKGTSYYGIFARNNSITINGGQVTANGGLRGIFANSGSVTINGGQVTAHGNIFGIYAYKGGSVTINGGQVTANGQIGIYASDGNITLGWSHASNFIFVSSYDEDFGRITIANNKTFITEDGSTYTSGQLNGDQLAAISDKTLYPYIEGSIPYIDENGQRQLCTDYNVLTGTETTLGTSGQETWYVVDGTLNYSQTITISGNVHLILKDNAVMNVGTEETPVNGNGIYSEGHSISIYAQSMGESQGQLHLNVNADDEVHQYCGIIALYSSITINGGKVSASGYSGILGVYAPININGGQVTVDGSGWGIYGDGNDININGGQVTANGGRYGIQAYGGNITLGWKNVTDFIYANSYDNNYYSTNITLSKAFIDEAGQTYSGTIAKESDGAYAINGKTLRPYSNSMLFLADDADNTAIISKFNSQPYNVTLAGRTLYKDGAWNTLCLPFDVTVGSGQMEGATAMTMNAAQSGFDSASGLLTLYFDGVGEGSTIAAGTPFIVKWTGNAGQFVENPMFSGVTISGTAAGSISFDGGSFRGTYNVMTFDAADPNVVLLEEGSNTLKYAASGDYLGACRAYFVVDPTAAGEGQTGARLTDYILHLGSLGLLEGSFNQRGDANGDGSISVTDIAVVVNCILQLTNNGGFSKYGADANGDGDITVTDIGVIVDLILGTSGNAASRRLTHDAPEPQ